MWMSEPMPVTTRIITADSGSSLNDSETAKSPERIHVYASFTIARESSGRPTRRATAATETANDASMTAHAMPPDTLLDSRRPKLALTTKPRSGRSGISSSIASPLQAGEGIGIERFPMPVQADDDGEAHRRFGR